MPCLLEGHKKLLARGASPPLLSPSPEASSLGSGAGWLGSVRVLLWVESSQLLDVPRVGKHPSLLVLSHPGFGAPRPGREHNHQVCWNQVSHI
jgi:hypothetical protein